MKLQNAFTRWSAALTTAACLVISGCGGGGSDATTKTPDAPTPTIALANIAFWGDSLTQPATISRVGELLPGRTFFNGGVGGQKSTEIAARQGGVPTLLSVAMDTIPTSGTVPVTFRSVSPMTSQGGGPITGTLAGISGTLNRATDDSYSFTRTASGASALVSTSTPFLVDTFGRDSWINVFWMGRNNAGDGAQVKADIASAVAFLKETPKKFIVLSILNGSYGPSESIGGAGYVLITQLNSDLAATYPNNYIDIRSYLVSQYDPTNSQDVIDFQNDLVPSSLRGDAIHLNLAGNLLVAKKIVDFISAKGW